MTINLLWLAAIPLWLFVWLAVAALVHRMSERIDWPRWTDWLGAPLFITGWFVWLGVLWLGFAALLPLAFGALR